MGIRVDLPANAENIKRNIWTWEKRGRQIAVKEVEMGKTKLNGKKGILPAS